MNEEQFEALKSLMQAIAYRETGEAIHQPRCKDIVEDAEDWARTTLGLPERQS